MRNFWFRSPERGPRGSLQFIKSDAIKMLEYTFCIIMKLRQTEIFYHYKKKNTERSQCTGYKNTYFRRKNLYL